jgi:hypothetical protein
VAGQLLEGKNESTQSDKESPTIEKPGCCAPGSSKPLKPWPTRPNHFFDTVFGSSGGIK